ncbi:MAG: hypothetical protein PHG89_07865 [Gallionella sp.]|nr:hypothetical protein [Gallionella sp.]
MSFDSHSGASGNLGLNESVGWIIADNFDNAELQRAASSPYGTKWNAGSDAAAIGFFPALRCASCGLRGYYETLIIPSLRDDAEIQCADFLARVRVVSTCTINSETDTPRTGASLNRVLMLALLRPSSSREM